MTGLKRITTDPAVMGGKPCIRGLRVTVGTIVGLVEPAEKQALLEAPGDAERATALLALLQMGAVASDTPGGRSVS